MISGVDLFLIVFGHNWYIAGQVSQVLALPAFLSYFSSATDRTAILAAKINYVPIWHGARLVAIGVLVYVAKTFNIDYSAFVTYYAGVMAMLYLIDIIYNYKCAK